MRNKFVYEANAKKKISMSTCEMNNDNEEWRMLCTIFIQSLIALPIGLTTMHWIERFSNECRK